MIAHEVGHHVQNLLGISDKVDAAPAGEPGALERAVGADGAAGRLLRRCGANNAQRANQRLMEPGDFEQGLKAAAAIGDDRLQQQGQGYVVPESFTHGTSDQRVYWLRRGMESGELSACDTFAANAR